MVDIKPVTAENRRGKVTKERKKERKEEEITAAKYNVRICYAGLL